MGVLPLELPAGETAASMGLTGEEVIDITGITALDAGTPTQVTVRASGSAGVLEFTARVRIDTPGEAMYYRHGGILPFMARRLAGLV